MKKLLNGELLDMTEDEILSQNTFREEYKTERDARITAKNNTETSKTSAITKLKALGLTDDEITAMIGE